MAKGSSVNQYDKIFRENIEPIFLSLIERELGISIVSKKLLLDKIISTTVREVDSLYEVKTTEGEKFILHIEIQTKNDSNMVLRVGEYHGLISKKYKIPIKHIVIYLGEKKATMRNSLKEDEIYRGFELFSLREMNTQLLLNSVIPEEVLLAVLSNFDKHHSEEVIQKIIIRLSKICKSKNELKKITSQLIILSKLRNLEMQTTTKVNDMTQLFDITTFNLYQRGELKGLEKGLEEGLKAEQKRVLIVVANMLTKSDLGVVQISDLAEVEESFVLDIREKLENNLWLHPDTWTDEQWVSYFENKKEDKIS